jgi:hypothetical protein
MATKIKGYKKGGRVSARKAAPKGKPKSKMPTLGGSLKGLSGTGASGMIP